jgi:hypothetical protein
MTQVAEQFGVGRGTALFPLSHFGGGVHETFRTFFEEPS